MKLNRLSPKYFFRTLANDTLYNTEKKQYISFIEESAMYSIQAHFCHWLTNSHLRYVCKTIKNKSPLSYNPQKVFPNSVRREVFPIA